MANTDTDIPSKIEDFSSFASNHTYKASNVPDIAHISPAIALTNSEYEITEIPLSIFNQGLSGLEALVFYLKQHKGLRFCDIAILLNRDDRTIWDSYTEGKKKASAFDFPEESIFIPLSIFQNRSFGVLEALSRHLKEERSLKFSQIAKLLGKNDRTIWTAYHRATKKLQRTNHAR